MPIQPFDAEAQEFLFVNVIAASSRLRTSWPGRWPSVSPSAGQRYSKAKPNLAKRRRQFGQLLLIVRICTLCCAVLVAASKHILRTGNCCGRPRNFHVQILKTQKRLIYVKKYVLKEWSHPFLSCCQPDSSGAQRNALDHHKKNGIADVRANPPEFHQSSVRSVLTLKILAKGNNGGVLPADASDVQSVASRVLLLLAAAQLNREIEHIKDIVTIQQSRAGVSKMVEPVQVRNLVEDPLRILELLADNRTHIVANSFTTRKISHGSGLHSGALRAVEGKL